MKNGQRMSIGHRKKNYTIHVHTHLSHYLWHIIFFFCRKYMSQLVTGYLPSVILLLFLYAVPPTMMLFAVIEGSISRSGRKKSACRKVLYFMIWNVFFVNVLSGSVIRQLDALSSPKEMPTQLARAIPAQVNLLPPILKSSSLGLWFSWWRNLTDFYHFCIPCWTRF